MSVLVLKPLAFLLILREVMGGQKNLILLFNQSLQKLILFPHTILYH